MMKKIKDWLCHIAIRMYRFSVGDVQVIKTYTGFDLERTIHLGYVNGKDDTRIFFNVRQVCHIKVYSRWWLNETLAYSYELSYMHIKRNDVLLHGDTIYPHLCSKWLAKTYHPHQIAIDCYLREHQAQSRGS